MSAPKVLVVDDEEPTLAMFRLVLPAFGLDPVTASSGEAGLARFVEDKPEVVITDIKMPGMDGLELLSRIKELSPETEVIVITGHGDAEMALTALNLRASDFIDKPISQAALRQALDRALTRRRKLARTTEASPIRMVRRGNVAVMEVSGSLSPDMERYVGEALSELALTTPKGLVVHLNGPVSISGAALTRLAQELQAPDLRDLTAFMVGLPPHYRPVLVAVGLAGRVRLADSLEDALAAFEGLE